jgi:hypothetical protein
MPISLTLPAAAGAAFDNLQLKWLGGLGGGLASSLIIFCQSVNTQFQEQDINSHPVINWNAIIWSLGTRLSLQTVVSLADLTLSAQYVYRICWMTNQLRIQNLISAPQATNVLQYYNSFIAVP